MVSVKINFIGTGCLLINQSNNGNLFTELKQTADQIHAPFEQSFFDADFFKKLQSKKYKSIYDFGNISKVYGLTNSPKSFVEIRIDGRKKRNIYFEDFKDKLNFFPDYNLHFENQNIDAPEYFTLTEMYIGTISSYQFLTEKFSIDSLHFHLKNIDCGGATYQILSDIKYDNTLLHKRFSDCVVNAQYGKINVA